METQQQNAPYAVAALVLGICSLLFGCFFVGLICGIIGLVLANKGLAAYRANPEIYSIVAVVVLGTAGFAWLNMFS